MMVQKIIGFVESKAVQDVTKPCLEHRGANFKKGK
jgi:hypothetical protein